MSADNKNQALLTALQAMQSYDQFGMIPNHKVVIHLILSCLVDDDKNSDIIAPNIESDLLELSSMLMTRAIERAKKN